MDIQMKQPFIHSVQLILKQMAGIDVETEGDFYKENSDIISYGVSSIINYVGKVKGRLLLDMEPDLALHIAKNVNGEEYASVRDYMVLATISELNNIIAGDANTYLNNEYGLGLRLSPPIVFTGHNPIINIPKIQSESMVCTTKSGKLKINVAFEGVV